MKVLSKPSFDLFVPLILLTVGVASVLPATGAFADVLGWATKIVIGLLFFIYGARLSPAQAWDGVKQWRLHGVVLAVTFVLFPLLGLAARLLVPSVLTPDLYTGLLFLCLVPSTVQSSIAFTSMARGNVAGAIVSASFSNIIGIVLTPLLVLALMSTTGGGIDASSIVDIVLQLLAPFVLGQLLRPWLRAPMERHAAKTKLVDRGSILLVVYAAFSEGMRQHIWSSVSALRIVAVAAVCAVLLAVVLGLTALLGRKLGFSRADRIVVLFCGSKKSLAAGLPMATVFFAGQPVGLIVLPLMIFHQVQLIVCSVLAQRFARAAAAEETGSPRLTTATTS